MYIAVSFVSFVGIVLLLCLSLFAFTNYSRLNAHILLINSNFVDYNLKMYM